MICVSISEPTVHGCLAALKGLEFAEIRLDKMEISKEDVKKIFSQKCKLIATCRPNGKSDQERKKLLISAIESGAVYVDVEVEAPDGYKKEVISAAKKKGCKIIVSYHNYEKTPPKAELDQVVDWCFQSGADLAKIACLANSDADNARLLGLLDANRKLVVVGMGEKGKITRIVAPLLGSVFTFASLEKGKETASGQIEKSELEKLIGELKNV